MRNDARAMPLLLNGMCILLILMSASNHSFESGTYLYTVYACLIVLMYADRKNIFIVLGSVNYMPSVQGINPLVICSAMMMLRSPFFAHDLLSLRINKVMVVLCVITMWVVLSALLTNDTGFLNSWLTILAVIVLVQVFLGSNRCDVAIFSRYYFLGLLNCLPLGLLIYIMPSAYESTHPFRLSIGERADPNSTGFLCAACTVACMHMGFTMKSLKKYIQALSWWLITLILLNHVMLTASRASMLAIVVTVLAYTVHAILMQIRTNGQNGILRILGYLAIAAPIVMISIYVVSVYADFVYTSYYNLIYRMTDAIDDGNRPYLMLSAISHTLTSPIYGVGIGNFKNSIGQVAHNTLGDYLLAMGLVGAFVYGHLFWRPLVVAYKYLRSCVPEYTIMYIMYCSMMINMLSYSAWNEKSPFIIAILLGGMVTSMGCKEK